ncbi:unnamed protein product [Somion occarium]|uniref:DUF6533 domain-containing protein n=1 Tax=Somion occarium TaxID=3059160 RepID=A0ABP1DKF6_9APHY
MQSQGAARSGIAALCFIVWDTLITLDEEVQFIWLTHWTPLKLLFFFTRYYAIAILIILNAHPLTCQQWIIVEGISAVLLELAVEVLLVLRIQAMYSGHTALIRMIVGLLVVQVIVMAVTLGISMPKIMTTENCINTEIPVEMVAYSIASIVYEAFLFTLAVVKLWSARKDGFERTTLLKVLVRDNMWTFAAILVVMIGNTILFTIAPATLAALGFPWALAIFGALGPRLMLNVRREHHRRSFTSYADISSLAFVQYSPVFNPGMLDPD